MSGPRNFWTTWQPLERRIQRARRRALLVDFDGTLVPIARSPEAPCLPQALRKLLAKIAARGVTVGVVSGRRLCDLRARVGVGGIWYVGSHGYSLRPPGGPAIHLVTAGQKRELARVRRRLRRRLQGLQGIHVEPKEASIAVHYRTASRRSRSQARRAVVEALQGAPYLRLLPGKKVWELLPDASASKWSAIQRILRHRRIRRAGVIFLGDDTTDEAVFGRLRGTSIAVGKRRHTSAQFFLDSPAEVGKFLRRYWEAVS